MSDATAISAYLKSLRLPAISSCYRALAEQARREGLSHEAYLQALLQEEVAQRRVRRVKSLLKGCAFSGHEDAGCLPFRRGGVTQSGDGA